MFVRLGSLLSTGFWVTNEVRHSGVLSPLLFNVYINDFSIILSQTGIGGSIDGKFVNHTIYANHLCVISLYSTGLACQTFFLVALCVNLQLKLSI